MTGDPSQANRVLQALVALARGATRSSPPAELAQGWHAVAGRLERRRMRRRLLLGSLVILVPVASALALGWRSMSTPSSSSAERALTYRVEGGSIADGGYLREAGDTGMTLLFAEGTEFRLLPEARGRLRGVDGRGAHLAIEQGSAAMRVTPRPGARWLVDAGPFVVTVKGTEFTISWDARAERLELGLKRGRVGVAGPVSGGEIALRAGQRLVVSLPKAQTVISEEGAQDGSNGSADGSKIRSNDGSEEDGLEEDLAEAMASGATAGAGPGPGDGRARVPNWPASGALTRRRATPHLAQGQPSLVPPSVGGQRSWAAAVAAGHWDDLLAQVDRTGIAPALENASSEDLLALADAARYRRRNGLAREALLAERRRFPGSARALDAAFLLGRLAETTEALSTALPWYDEYLRRAPAGTYASEALGRKMIATERLEGTASAQTIASEYLLRFPHGAYAGSARALLRHGQ